MARSYEEFREQNKNKLKEEFRNKHNDVPDENASVQKQKNLKPGNHLEQRIKEKMLEITEERGAPQPTPEFVAGQNLSLDSIHREAIRRVQLETVEQKKEWKKNMVENTENKNQTEAPQTDQKAEQAQDNQIQESIDAQNQDNNIERPESVVETESEQEDAKPDKAFKAQIHQIVDEAQKHRSEASRTFIKNRKELLAEAEQRGAEHPAREVSTAQREVHKIINANEHKQLHALFQENGWDYDKQGVQFIESETNTHNNTQEHAESTELKHSITQGEER